MYTCVAGGKTWANGAWKTADIPGVVEDSSCAGNLIGLTVPAGARMADNTSSALTFTSPAGTTIADFTLTRQIGYNEPGRRRDASLLRQLLARPDRLRGSGELPQPDARCAELSEAVVRLSGGQRGGGQEHGQSRASSPRSPPTPATPTNSSCASAASTARRRARSTPAARISHILHGSDITINDPTPPALAVEASGLLSGGARNGSDPVTLTATDGAGIRRVELLDVTNPAAPALVGYEDYGESRTDANRICDYSQAGPCPSLSHETVRATALPAGQRLVTVRVTDTGGNVVDSGPYPVFAVTPSDRGAFNGAGATESGTLAVVWTAGGKSNRRTLSYGAKAGIRGRLLNSDGQPVTGAKVLLLTRDLRQGALLIPRTTVTTDRDGRFHTTVSATASRLLQFAWLSRVNDIRFAANGYLTLQARASSTLTVATRRPRVGRSFTISGQLRGVSRGGVPVVVQGRARGSRRYETFADTTTSSSGRFKVRYRFRSSGSRGRSFVFRARIRPASRFPYETGYSKTVTVRVRG